MGLLDLPGLIKRTLARKQGGCFTSRGAASNPHEHNSALFERFYRDLENNALPEIPSPTQAEIIDYTRRRAESLTAEGPISDSFDRNLLQENHSIPVEVDIWVDKVYSYYFSNLISVLGLVVSCEGARGSLYKYRGYNWHSIFELYPTVLFD